jgi:hypothetical protein
MPLDNPTYIADIEDDVTVIKAVSGQKQLYETGDTLTTDGNEQTLYVNESPSGVFDPVCVMIDFTAQTVTETVTVKVYYRIKSGGNYILLDEDEFIAAQDPDLKLIELEPNRFGIKITIEKTAGTNRAYDWEVHYYA